MKSCDLKRDISWRLVNAKAVSEAFQPNHSLEDKSLLSETSASKVFNDIAASRFLKLLVFYRKSSNSATDEAIPLIEDRRFSINPCA